jgi:streptogramin lyase
VVPVGIDRHPDGSIWVTDAAQHALFRIPPEGGDSQVVLRGPGTGKTELYRPRSVQIAGDGSVWVLDHGNHRGVVIDPNGALRHFGSEPYLPDGGVRMRQLKLQQKKLQEQR